MNLKLYSYRAGKDRLEKEITKLEKQMQKVSAQLYEMTDRNSTVRQRANKRMRLAQIGEELRWKQEYVSEINKLIEEEIV